MMELSQSKSGVFGVLVQHCCEAWLPTGGRHDDTAFSGVFSHVGILAEACTYGPVFRRDQRYLQITLRFVLIRLRTDSNTFHVPF